MYISVILWHSTPAYPNDPTTLRAILQRDLETSVVQLEQTLGVIQTQRKELEEELNREKLLLEQHKEVQQSLQEKLEEAKGAALLQHNSDKGLKELSKKRLRALELQQDLMRRLAHFATKHFPLPSQADINKTSKRVGERVPAHNLGLGLFIFQQSEATIF